MINTDKLQQMQQADLYKEIAASKPGKAPLVLKVITTPKPTYVSGGVPVDQRKTENYILLSALPDELRQKVINAIQILQSSF